MKHLKLGVLICGALGIAGLLMVGIGVLMQVDQAFVILMLAAFGLPVVMAVVAVARPPLQAWQAGVSLAGFALAAWKLRIWEVIPRFASAPSGQKLMVIGAVVGMILTVIAILRPPDGA